MNDRLHTDSRARPTFLVATSLLFGSSTVVTAVVAKSMSGADAMRMPGGWSMSMTWMRMPGQTWITGAASFVGMWAVMMIAMMIPSVAPVFWRYGMSIHSARRERLTLLAALGYFSVWALLGLIVYPVGVVVADLEMTHTAIARIVPQAAAILVVAGSAVQFTKWKARYLRCCRNAPEGGAGESYAAACRFGIRLGIRCCTCCANLTVILLVAGVMDLRAMALVTLAISGERLVTSDETARRGIGSAGIAAGLFLLANAM